MFAGLLVIVERRVLVVDAGTVHALMQPVVGALQRGAQLLVAHAPRVAGASVST